jgi:hypothetical protein
MRLLRQTRTCKVSVALIIKALSRLAEAEVSKRYPPVASSEGWVEPAEDAKSTLINLSLMVFNLLNYRSYV